MVVDFWPAMAARAAAEPDRCVCCEEGVAVAELAVRDLPVCWWCREIIEGEAAEP